MVETAIAVRESPAIEIDLTKASPRVLRHLKKERDKERAIDLLKTGLDFIKPVVTNEMFLTLAAFGVGNKMLQNYEAHRDKPVFPWLEPFEATLLGAGIIAIAVARAGSK